MPECKTPEAAEVDLVVSLDTQVAETRAVLDRMFDAGRPQRVPASMGKDSTLALDLILTTASEKKQNNHSDGILLTLPLGEGAS